MIMVISNYMVLLCELADYADVSINKIQNSVTLVGKVVST